MAKKHIYLSKASCIIFVLIISILQACAMRFNKSHKKDSTANITTITKNPAQRDSIVNRAISLGETFLGKPYRYRKGLPWQFDCSGFVSYLYKNEGISLPHSSASMHKKTKAISRNEAQKGDLIFFTGRNSRSRRVGHVGIILKNDSTGITFIHSSVSKGIEKQRLSHPYYSKRLIGFGKLPEKTTKKRLIQKNN